MNLTCEKIVIIIIIIIYLELSAIATYLAYKCNENNISSFQSISSLCIAFLLPFIYLPLKIIGYSYTGYMCINDFINEINN
jgi:hypothetical protein